jgi:hypothetical protein
MTDAIQNACRHVYLTTQNPLRCHETLLRLCVAMETRHSTCIMALKLKSKSKSHYDRQSVGQSNLVPGAHLGPAINFSFSLRFYFRQLTVCYFVAPSLTRGRVCNLLLLLVLASAVTLGSALSNERSGVPFVSISL